MRARRMAGVTTAAVALLVLALGASGPAQAKKRECKVQDASGIWEGTFTSEVLGGGEVTLIITQRHRRYHVTALANNAMLVEGDGTIAASGRSHFNGEGPLIDKVNAKGMVQGECFASSAEFHYQATYADGTRDSGEVVLPFHFPAGGGT
jgi:hypothetical protein